MASKLVRIEESIYKQLKKMKKKSRLSVAYLVTQACMDAYNLKVKP